MYSCKLILGIIVIAVAYYYKNNNFYGLDEEELIKSDIVEAWQAIVKVPEAHFHRISVGYVDPAADVL